MHATFGINPQASGSCYLELAHTRVQCSIFGPREASKNLSTSFLTETEGSADGQDIAAPGTLECTVQFAPFSRRSRSVDAALLNSEAEERRLCRALHKALAPSILLARLPRSVIEVHCLVLEARGGEEAAAVAGASFALADAGIELAGLCACASVLGEDVDSGGSSARLQSGFAATPRNHRACGQSKTFRATLAQIAAPNDITLAQVDREAGAAADVSSALRCAMEACADLNSHMRAALARSIERKSRAQQS
jgi:ribonuclease PH